MLVVRLWTFFLFSYWRLFLGPLDVSRMQDFWEFHLRSPPGTHNKTLQCLQGADVLSIRHALFEKQWFNLISFISVTTVLWCMPTHSITSHSSWWWQVACRWKTDPGFTWDAISGLLSQWGAWQSPRQEVLQCDRQYMQSLQPGVASPTLMHTYWCVHAIVHMNTLTGSAIPERPRCQRDLRPCQDHRRL